MVFLITALHIFACIALIIIVLLQAGKGADIGASMGGAGGQTLFGTSSSATMISKVTTGIAILFMLTSLYLAYTSGKSVNSSVMDNTATVTEKAVPADVPDTTETDSKQNTVDTSEAAATPSTDETATEQKTE